MAKDVVCGMEVNPETALFRVEYEGETYYFCSKGCAQAFKKEPKKYLERGETEEHRMRPSTRV